MSFFVAGLLGGLLRGGVGVSKYITSYKDVEIRPYYFAGTVLFSGIVGYVSVWIAADLAEVFLEVERLPIAFALIVGYAGGDFIENAFKIVAKQPQFFDIGRKLKKIKKEEEQ